MFSTKTTDETITATIATLIEGIEMGALKEPATDREWSEAIMAGHEVATDMDDDLPMLALDGFQQAMIRNGVLDCI